MSPAREQRKPSFVQPTVASGARDRTPRPVLPRNLNSQDTPAERDARRRQAAISREHRSIRRGGGEPSPTPNLEEPLWTTQTQSSLEGREPSSQRSSLGTSTSLRPNTCRFNYPAALRQEPAVEKAMGSSYLRFQPVRNDGRLNNYNRLVSLAWLANTDIAPCTGSRAVLNYIGKYCTKAEQKSENYRQVIQHLLPNLNVTKPLLSLVSKTMNRLIGERDWSAQEVCHLLLDLPLQIASRVVLLVDCHPESHQATTYCLEEDGESLKRGQSPLERYKLRPEEPKDLAYLRVFRLYDFRGPPEKMTLRPRVLPRILNYFPHYRPTVDVEEYARVKLTLHVPFRAVDDLLRLDNCDPPFASFADAWSYWQVTHSHNAESDYMEEPPPEPEEDDFEDLHVDDDADAQASWELLAQQLPDHDAAVRLEDPDKLGDRDLDRSYDWSPHVGRYPTLSDDFWKQMKVTSPAHLAAISSANPDELEVKQRQLFNHIVSYYSRVRAGRDFYYGAVSCSRIQFPITNAAAITVHKAQGMTVKKAVLNLTARDFVAGLSYVAVSRVKSLRGILFEEPFDFECFRVRISDTVKSRLADRERRRPEHVGWTAREERDIPLRSSPPPIPSSPMGPPQS
ncbi:uncharacterized protein Z518_05635 [Rhinocladiella mackenziei CBS 650.93]|uniref:ATP-dependent DNA helicase n=1 Tax=Rhinocladiella mackenziei CBS 650.93 TaxID=1442369 RepID=A0A0D2J6S4_9EURO|nr:uncharacterized protein Z518_05635 [Rhinocladiella mackenziei CBS 650.93]KIX04765.1 hypothetical protein Z518_05635 [Rhinocladiella mackenziei CBS 650.93]